MISCSHWGMFELPGIALMNKELSQMGLKLTDDAVWRVSLPEPSYDSKYLHG